MDIIALATHFLPEESAALRGSYLIFHIALWIVIAVFTFQKICIFAVEIVLLYYLVHGGFICVFSGPNLGDSKPVMMDLHWSKVIIFLSFLMMLTHVVWFIVFGRSSFPDMPCGTTIFFFGPVKGIWMDVLALWLGASISGVVIAVIVPACGFCFIFAGQIFESMMKSSFY